MKRFASPANDDKMGQGEILISASLGFYVED